MVPPDSHPATPLPSAPAAKPLPATDGPWGTGATLLLAEDDPLLRSLLARILRMEGFQVLEAGNGLEALEIAAAEDQGIDALVTDVVMPRLGGLELARELRRRRPRLRTLFMSGCSKEELLEDGVDAPLLIQKPFRPHQLIHALDALLVE